MTKSAANLAARTLFAVTTADSGNPNLAGLISNGADGLNVRRNNSTAGYRAPGAGQDANDFTGNGTPTGTLTVNNGPNALYTPDSPHLVIATAGSAKKLFHLLAGQCQFQPCSQLEGQCGGNPDL